MDINERMENIVERFSSYKDWESKYKAIIDMGKSMPEFPEEDRVDENKVKGCQSQVWLVPELREGRVYFRADSDASIVRGIVAILLEVYSGSTPHEIINTRPTFIDKIGLRQHLSMSRANGLNAMLKKITMYGIALKTKMEMEK